MSNIECVNFTLKTRDINSSLVYSEYITDVITPTGEIKNSRSDYTWYNVNIRDIIGNEMYGKYNKFNICLNNYVMSSRGPTADTDDNNTFYLKMSGLPWCSSYDQSTRTNNTYQTIRCIKIPATANITDCQYFNDKVYFTFGKATENININLKLVVISSDASPKYTVVSPDLPSIKYLGQMAFNFSIYPIIEK